MSSTAPIIIDVPVRYTIMFKRKRERLTKPLDVLEMVPVALRVMEDEDAPISFRLDEKAGHSFGYRDELPHELRSTADQHWGLIVGDNGEPRDFEKFVAYLQAGSHFASGGACYGKATPLAEIGEGVIESSERDQDIAKLHQAISRYFALGGQIWEKCSEPVWHVTPPYRNGGWQLNVRKLSDLKPPRDGKKVFPADRFDAAMERLRTINEHFVNPRPIEVIGQIEVVRPDCVRYRHDQEPEFREMAKREFVNARDDITRSVDKVEIEVFLAYRALKDKVGDDQPIEEVVAAVRAFREAAAKGDWAHWISRVDEALSKWDAFQADRADDAAIGLAL